MPMDEERALGSYKPKVKGEEYEIAKMTFREPLKISTYSNETYEANQLLSDFQGNFRKVVQLSHYYTDKIGILKSAVRMYVTLTLGDIHLEGGSKQNLKFFENLIEELELNKVVRQSVPDLYKAGNIFWYRETEGDETVWIHQLNPMDCYVKGHKRGKPVIEFHSTNDPDTLPDDLVGFNSTYKLSKDKTYHCSLDREGYLRYGKPVTTGAFEPIQHIQALMDMEKETIDSVVESMIIITLGDEKRPATRNQIHELKKEVQKLKSTSRLVGNHTLKAQVIEKDVSVFNPEKFDVPMKMLMQSIGITPSIFTGEGSYSTASAGMSGAKKTIENARVEIEETLNAMFKDIAKEKGLNPKKNPKVSLGMFDLTDEEIRHSIVRNLYLDGVISAETYAHVHGYDIDLEQTLIDEEEKWEITPRPMSSTMSGKDDGEDGGNQPNEKSPQQKENKGRPKQAGKDSKQSNNYVRPSNNK